MTSAIIAQQQQPLHLMQAVKCFLCDHDFLEGEQTWLLFDRRLQEDGQPECALAAILTSALGKDIEEHSAHSKLLCHTCNALLLEFERIELRFYEMRFRILSAYNKTARLNDLLPIAIEINGVLQDTAMLEEMGADELLHATSPELLAAAPKLDYTELMCEELPLDAIVELPEEDDETLNTDIVLPHDKQIELDVAPLDEDADAVVFGGLHPLKLETANMLQYETVKEVGDCMIDVEDIDLDSDEIYSEIIEHTAQQQYVIEEENCEELEQEEASMDSQYMQSYSSNSELHTADLLLQSAAATATTNADNVVALPKRTPRQLKDTSNTSMYEHQGDIYTCLLCANEPPEEFTPKSFAEHMRAVHNYRFYTCDLCGSGFARRQDLNDHIDSEHGSQEPGGVGGNYECETCHRIFDNYRLFRIHKRMHYSSAKQFACTECDKKYSSKTLLDGHMNMHTGARPFKCSQCPKDFASKYTLQTHAKIHSDRARPYRCDLCDKAFLNQQNLNQHRKLHMGIKSFVCDICQKAFGTQHNLYVHQVVHSGNKPFICRTCGKAFARRAEIKDHERIHTGERPFKCDLCDLAFAQRSNLTSHRKSTHLNEKLHQCTHCTRSFKRRRLLEYHVQSTHTGERPHKCDHCEATFVYPEHRKKHMRIHMGIKPYACEVCGKQFNSRDNRNAHRFIHSDKKPYECLECGAGFMRKPLLLAHMQHTRHSNDTIIVNQPQIGIGQEDISQSSSNAADIDLKHLIDGDEEDDEDIEDAGDNVEEDDDDDDDDDSYAHLLQRAESMLAAAENNAADDDSSNDAMARVSGQLIKDEIGDVKYLQFEELDGDGHQTLTWVDIGDKHS